MTSAERFFINSILVTLVKTDIENEEPTIHTKDILFYFVYWSCSTCKRSVKKPFMIYQPKQLMENYSISLYLKGKKC